MSPRTVRLPGALTLPLARYTLALGGRLVVQCATDRRRAALKERQANGACVGQLTGEPRAMTSDHTEGLK